MRTDLWLGFAAFCILCSSAWLIAPGELPTLERECLVYAIMGLGALLLRARGLRKRVRELSWLRLMLCGVGFLGVSAVLMEWVGRGLPAMSISAGFGLLPVVLIVMAGSSRSGDEGEARRLLAPALAAFGGVLLLLPVEAGATVRGRVMLGVLLVSVVWVGITGVWLYWLLQGFKIGDAVAIVCAANGLFLWLWCRANGSSVVLGKVSEIVSLASLVNAVEVLLLIWLVREMSPVLFGARYLLIPLLTVTEGYLLLRPELTVRMGAGAVLVAAGAWRMLSSKGSNEDTATLSLR